MTNQKLSLLLHPIRLRIISRLSATGPQTTADLQNHLPDVAQATLYRQLQTLLKSNIIQILEQRQVRGTVEKVYILTEQAESISPDAIRAMSKDQQLDMFTNFIAKLIEDYHAYLQFEDTDPLRDGVGVRKVSLWMNDSEFETFTDQLKTLFAPYMKHTPGNGRRLRTMTNVLIPSTPPSEQTHSVDNKPVDNKPVDNKSVNNIPNNIDNKISNNEPIEGEHNDDGNL